MSATFNRSIYPRKCKASKSNGIDGILFNSSIMFYGEMQEELSFKYLLS